MLALLAVAGAGVAAVQVTDAARAAARAAALGEDAAVVVAVGRQLAGDHAQVHLSTDADLVVVTVTRRLPGPLGAADLTARATARARPEPGR
ncbi:TadE family type IV pilus minor pilin [Georgenia sp. 10Sc9-8]|uniref:TadE family type IV pilus minor pilin n=1 Tax=Georgenia halotolerans TaxID=3028317 RepID=A0ABT5U2U1_9MICO|nr:TadE family type IV pilus minor pilin [Georgenia halotolerans]